jgi:hypothetical protein
VEEIREIYSLCKILQNVVKDYSAIGTVEEFKALKEKNEPKKPIKNNPIINEGWSKEATLCPMCNGYVSRFGDNYCPKCGNKLDWQ